MNMSGIFSTKVLQNIHLNLSSTSKKVSGNVFCFCTCRTGDGHMKGRPGRHLGQTCKQWVDKMKQTPSGIMQSDAATQPTAINDHRVKQTPLGVKCNSADLTHKYQLQVYCIIASYCNV